MAYKAVKSLIPDRLSEAGKRQTDIVRDFDMDKGQVSRYVNGIDILPLDYAKSWAEYLGCSVDSLYKWSEVPNSEIRRRKRR